MQIAWMRGGKYPDMPFNQQMTFPCDLTLRTVDGSLRVFRQPAREIERLQGKEHAWSDALGPRRGQAAATCPAICSASWPRSRSLRARP